MLPLADGCMVHIVGHRDSLLLNEDAFPNPNKKKFLLNNRNSIYAFV